MSFPSKGKFFSLLLNISALITHYLQKEDIRAYHIITPTYPKAAIQCATADQAAIILQLHISQGCHATHIQLPYPTQPPTLVQPPKSSPAASPGQAFFFTNQHSYSLACHLASAFASIPSIARVPRCFPEKSDAPSWIAAHNYITMVRCHLGSYSDYFDRQLLTKDQDQIAKACAQAVVKFIGNTKNNGRTR